MEASNLTIKGHISNTVLTPNLVPSLVLFYSLHLLVLWRLLVRKVALSLLQISGQFFSGINHYHLHRRGISYSNSPQWEIFHWQWIQKHDMRWLWSFNFKPTTCCSVSLYGVCSESFNYEDVSFNHEDVKPTVFNCCCLFCHDVFKPTCLSSSALHSATQEAL